MLLEFYGRECGHCKNLEPLVVRLEQELGVTVQRHETWHDESNEKMRQEYDSVGCGGVPFLVNTETKAVVCGEVSYEQLKEWATGSAERGFTLLEILLVVAAIGILAGMVVSAINPSRQLSEARNNQRAVDVNAILTAVYQYALDHGRSLPSAIPSGSDCSSVPTPICQTGAESCVGATDMTALTENGRYLNTMPTDPQIAPGSSLSTGYIILTTGPNHVLVCAPLAELNQTIQVSH